MNNEAIPTCLGIIHNRRSETTSNLALSRPSKLSYRGQRRGMAEKIGYGGVFHIRSGLISSP